MSNGLFGASFDTPAFERMSFKSLIGLCEGSQEFPLSLEISDRLFDCDGLRSAGKRKFP